MKTIIGAVCASLALMALTPAQAWANPQHERMRRCNAEAKEQTLKGEERKAFMSTCLRGRHEAGAAPAAAGAAPAAAPAAAGVDGVLLVDLPPEEAASFQDAFDAAGLALVMLASPTTTDERAAMLCAKAQGYLYYVSYAGVTGADHLDAGVAGQRLAQLRAAARVPVVAGFGIKDAASAAAMAVDADGVVVGSALVAAMAGAASADEAAARAKAFLAPLRKALDANP